jgi:hypothetical protein
LAGPVTSRPSCTIVGIAAATAILIVERAQSGVSASHASTVCPSRATHAPKARHAIGFTLQPPKEFVSIVACQVEEALAA